MLNPLVNIYNLTCIEPYKEKCFSTFAFWKHVLILCYFSFQSDPIFQGQHDKTVYCWQYKQGPTVKAARLSKI